MSTNQRHYPLVEARHEREPDSVPGPFYVEKDACMIWSLPCETAPQNIKWSEKLLESEVHGEIPDHCIVVKQPETDEELELMIEALEGSCISALRYCGTDGPTLDRLRDAGVATVCDALPESSGN